MFIRGVCKHPACLVSCSCPVPGVHMNKHQKHARYDAGSDIFDFDCRIRARLSHIRVDWLAEFQSFEGCMETLSNFFFLFASQSVSIGEWTSKSLISSAGTAPTNRSCTLRVKGGNALLLISAACNQRILPQKHLTLSKYCEESHQPTDCKHQWQTIDHSTGNNKQARDTGNSQQSNSREAGNRRRQQASANRRQTLDDKHQTTVSCSWLPCSQQPSLAALVTVGAT